MDRQTMLDCWFGEKQGAWQQEEFICPYLCIKCWRVENAASLLQTANMALWPSIGKQSFDQSLSERDAGGTDACSRIQPAQWFFSLFPLWIYCVFIWCLRPLFWPHNISTSCTAGAWMSNSLQKSSTTSKTPPDIPNNSAKSGNVFKYYYHSK